MRHFAAAHLGRVSVVMMARVNSVKELAARLRTRTSRGIAFTIFCQRSGAPMTPVEQTKICDGCRRPSSRASFSAVVAAAERPSEPVQQLALPELTITPRMRCADCRRCNCEAITGAAFTRLVVKTAAADAGVSLISMAKSSLDFFRPQCVAAKMKPCGMSALDRRVVMDLRVSRPESGLWNPKRWATRPDRELPWRSPRRVCRFVAGSRRGNSRSFEELWSMRDCENTRDAAAAGLREGGGDQARTESLAAIFGVHRDGADFSEVGTVTFQRKATHDLAVFFLNDKVANIGANFFRGTGKQQALRGIMRYERVNRRGVRNFRATRSHGFSSSLARRALKSCRAERTAPGAVPPRVARRARADSSVSAVAKLGPNAGENSLSRSSGISRMDIPSRSAARSTFPTISCASRKGTPKVTR